MLAGHPYGELVVIYRPPEAALWTDKLATESGLPVLHTQARVSGKALGSSDLLSVY